MLPESLLASGSLCVVGNINRDIQASPLAPGPHVFQDGETSVEWIRETVGGGGANSAFAAAALGARVSFVSKIGADALGTRLERTLRRQGISAFLARDAVHPTGTSLALSFQNGHRHFFSCLPANAALRVEDIDLAALAGCRHLLRADLWFSTAMLFGGNAELFRVAKQQGMSISVDLNWDPQWGVAEAATVRQRKQAVRDVLPWVDLAHGNVRELCEFADAAALPTALQRISDWGARGVVVHLGAQGAGFYRAGIWETEPPVLAKSPVTHTGSGDVLSVCLMLLDHQTDASMSDRLKLANKIVAEYMEGKRRLVPRLED